MNNQNIGLPSIHSILNSSFHDDWKETVQRIYLPKVKLPSFSQLYQYQYQYHQQHPYLSNKRADPILHIRFPISASKAVVAAGHPLHYTPTVVAANTTTTSTTTIPSPGSLSKPGVHTATTTTTVVRKRRYDRYRCTQCSKVFSRPSSLRVHILSHTGEKPHMCPRYGCGRKFSVYSNMRRHLKIHE